MNVIARLFGLLVFGLLLTGTSTAEATCLCSGNECTAAGLSEADFDACNAAAPTGATVFFPSGTATWTQPVTITKKLKLLGAGTGNSVVTFGAGIGTTALALGTTNTTVTGFTFVSSEVTDVFISARGSDGTGRIHHNEFISAGFRRCVYLYGEEPTVPHPAYLIDHNTFTNCRVSVVADLNSQFGEREWVAVRPFGVLTNVVYVEDNTFTFTVHGNAIEPDYGGMVVARFNTISWNSGASGAPIELHGTGAWADRSGRWIETYHNVFQGNAGSFTGIWYRGGSGLIFGNTFTSNYSTPIIFDVSTDRNASVGMPDGTKPQDGNYFTSGATYPGAGWPALDQPGFGTYAGAFDGTNFPGMEKAPIPIFLNRKNGAQASVGTANGGERWIANCHEYQNEVAYANFDGSCGTSIGTKAQLLARTTCTTTTPGSTAVNGTSAVFFWVTDEGEWNAKNPGPDGRLYKCMASNVWQLFYTPHSYPHPLARLQPPRNPRISGY